MIYYISLNSFAFSISVGTSQGFSIYSLNPPTLKFSRSMDTPIGIVEQLRSTNIIAVVEYQSNTLNFWDDLTRQIIETLSFSSIIRRVQFSNKHIIVILDKEIFVYELEKLSLIHQLTTGSNPHSLGIITSKEELLVPGLVAGQIIWDCNKVGQKILKVSSHPLRQIMSNQEGTLLATCSVEGTNIKLIDLNNGQILHTFRRGLEMVDIRGIGFNREEMVVWSNKKTVHLFNLRTHLHRTYEINVKDPIIRQKVDGLIVVWADNLKGYISDYIFRDDKLVEMSRITLLI